MCLTLKNTSAFLAVCVEICKAYKNFKCKNMPVTCSLFMHCWKMLCWSMTFRMPHGLSSESELLIRAAEQESRAELESVGVDRSTVLTGVWAGVSEMWPTRMPARSRRATPGSRRWLWTNGYAPSRKHWKTGRKWEWQRVRVGQHNRENTSKNLKSSDIEKQIRKQYFK